MSFCVCTCDPMRAVGLTRLGERFVWWVPMRGRQVIQVGRPPRVVSNAWVGSAPRWGVLRAYACAGPQERAAWRKGGRCVRTVRSLPAEPAAVVTERSARSAVAPVNWNDASIVSPFCCHFPSGASLILTATSLAEVCPDSPPDICPLACVNRAVAYPKREEDRLGLLRRCLQHGRGFPGRIGGAAKVKSSPWITGTTVRRLRASRGDRRERRRDGSQVRRPARSADRWRTRAFDVPSVAL